jgi:hypothetical protein
MWKDRNRLRPRILDLDGGLVRQSLLLRRARPDIVSLQSWGPQLRLACTPRHFERFTAHLNQLLGSTRETASSLTFLGSGDFHHLSLALLRRLPGRCNLLVLDNHPDWMRGLPFLHCGTWLFHAAQLATVRRIFLVGGDVDFDNRYRWLAPWKMLNSGKIVVFPALRRFHGGRWHDIEHQPLRSRAEEPADCERIEALLAPYRAELAACPLYISLDKDALSASESVVNWDSGHLTLPELLAVMEAFLSAANRDLAGMDVVGDWSPVYVRGCVRRLLHWTEHPRQLIDPCEATRRNEALNLRLLDELILGVAAPPLARSAPAPG